MIHVAHLLTCLGRGGAERALSDIVAATDRSRFHHTVCYLQPPHDLVDDFRRAGCDTLFLDAGPARNWFGAARKLAPMLERMKPDLVQSATSDANIVARLAARRATRRHLSWLVSMEYDPAAIRAAGWPPLKMEIRRRIERWTARRAGSRFVACSAAVMQSAKERLGVPPERIELIYNPVGLASIEAASGDAAALRARLGVAGDAFVYLIVGRMDAAKAHAIALDAFGRVAAAQPNAHFVMIGRGPLRQVLEARVAASGLGHRVHLIESVETIAPYFAAADAFLFPSLLEGLPVALLEAMSAGLPAVVSDIPPHVEVVDDRRTGLIVPRGSAALMADAMQRLYVDPALRRRLGGAAREDAVGRFSTAAVVPQWERLYQRLAGEVR